MKYKKLLPALLIFAVSLGFAGTALAASGGGYLSISYVSIPQINKTTTFILYCPDTPQFITTPGNENKTLVYASSYVNKNCQLRLRGLNNSGNYTTVPLANLTFSDPLGILTVKTFQPTSRGEEGNPTGIYIKLGTKLVALKTSGLNYLYTNGENQFLFSDLPPTSTK